MTFDTYRPACMCDVCDCKASPEIAMHLARKPRGKHITVCTSCIEDYEQGDHVQCANCDAYVPRDTEWSCYDVDAGEFFCFLCSGMKGFYEQNPHLRRTA